MKSLHSKSLFICSLICAISFAFTAPCFADDAPADLSGTYTCEGNSGGSSNYTGTVTITKKGDTYRLVWKLASGETYSGIGVVQGTVLAVSFYGSASGVVAYTLGDKLAGKWSMVSGDGTVGTETLSK